MSQINQAIPRLEQAFKMLDCVVPIKYPNALVVCAEDKQYHVNYVDEVCECPDHQFRQVKCKHIWACQLKLKAQEMPQV